MFHGLRGVPDIIGILPPHAVLDGEPVGGHFLGIEVKRPGKALSPDQAHWQERAAENGGVALCVHSLGELIEDLTPVLNLTQMRMEF